jgi:UDP-3-O-[3-hydroxymyristoyl] N-acetylglucosamine deacetylase
MEQLENYWFADVTKQKTLKYPLWCLGVGLHSEEQVKVQLNPAEENTGIIFQIMNDQNNVVAHIPAKITNLTDSNLRTVLSSNKFSISTTEHLLAAASAYGISNMLIQVWGSELPIFDGSAAIWTFLLDCAGVQDQTSLLKSIRVVREVIVRNGLSWCKLSPGIGLQVDYCLNYDHPSVGEQYFSTYVDKNMFTLHLSRARTFGFIKDLDYVRSQGLAKGADLSNTLVFDATKLLNQNQLIWPNELARHKIVDAIGDLALAGSPIQGIFRGNQSGHALNHRLVRELLSDTANWTWS